MAPASQRLVTALQRIEPKPQPWGALAVDAYGVIAALECPLWVISRRNGPFCVMSVLLLEADIRQRDVRYVP